MLSAEEAKSRVSQWVRRSKTLRIFVFGKLGSGKSTLINSLLNQEIANVGSGLTAVTQVVEKFSGVVPCIEKHDITINDIVVTLWDTPGLQDPYVNKEDILEDITTNNSRNVDLYVYCVQMTQTRAEEGDFKAIADLTDALGVDFWKRAFFALTFANEVKKPLSGDNQTLEEYFDNRVEQWTKVLRSAAFNAGVEQNDVKHIPVIPTSYRDDPLPVPRQDGRWFTLFWSTCLERMRFMSIPALLTVNQEEWTTHEASDVIATRVITQRLMAMGDQIEQQFEASLYEIPSEDMWIYLKRAIQGPTEESDGTVSNIQNSAVGEVQNWQTSVSKHYIIGLTIVGTVLAICYVAFHSRK